MLVAGLRLRWIAISYFLISGGVAIAMAALGTAWFASGTLSPELVAKLVAYARTGIQAGEPLPVSIANIELATALTYATGTALGALFAGRASPHKSIVEPAIAAALVVGSFMLAIYLTPMGELLVGLTRGHLERMISILAGAGIVAGLVGAVLGELASFGTASAGFVRRTGLSLVIAAGALWSSSIIFGIFFANEVAERAIANFANPESRVIVEVSAARIVTFAAVAAACAALASGCAAQLAARSPAVAPAAVAAMILLGALGAMSGLLPNVPSNLAAQISVGCGVVGAALASSSAFLTWMVVGAR